jgi:hypothetical protein
MSNEAISEKELTRLSAINERNRRQAFVADERNNLISLCGIQLFPVRFDLLLYFSLSALCSVKGRPLGIYHAGQHHHYHPNNCITLWDSDVFGKTSGFAI